ncbi:MAG: PAS domain-containing protein, partial [Chloroflexi bacterium]
LEKREEEATRLHSILASIDEGIIMQNNEGRIILINEAARRLLGTQKNFWDSELGTLFDAYRDVSNLNNELAPLGEPTRVQVNNRILGAQLAAVADSEGNRLGTMIVLRDITREALAERLKDSFITHISHELKTPMTVIKGMSEVLQALPEGQPVNKRFLETLGRNVDILDRMVVELLDISEISAENFSIRQDLLNLERLIWSVINGMRPEIIEADLTMMFMPRNLEQLYVIGDDQRLRWALGHLLRNAIVYNVAGGYVQITAEVTSDNQIKIQVIDNGVGISDRDLPHIFERFYRGEPRTIEGKRLDPRGLGQGLFVARTVIETHGGYIGVQTKVGEGSTFTVMLPMAEQQNALP